MDSNENKSVNESNNPWKTGAIATGAALVILVAAGFTFAAFNQTSEQQPQQVAASQATPAATPRPRPSASAPGPATRSEPRENCNQYLAGSTRDNTAVLKDGAVGAMVGAGTGAAGGAIADGGSGAGKGAGIGAVVGAVAGAVHGFTEENKRVDSANRAYENCLARNG